MESGGERNVSPEREMFAFELLLFPIVGILYTADVGLEALSLLFIKQVAWLDIPSKIINVNRVIFIKDTVIPSTVITKVSPVAKTSVEVILNVGEMFTDG